MAAALAAVGVPVGLTGPGPFSQSASPYAVLGYAAALAVSASSHSPPLLPSSSSYTATAADATAGEASSAGGDSTSRSLGTSASVRGRAAGQVLPLRSGSGRSWITRASSSGGAATGGLSGLGSGGDSGGAGAGAAHNVAPYYHANRRQQQSLQPPVRGRRGSGSGGGGGCEAGSRDYPGCLVGLHLVEPPVRSKLL